MIEERMANFGVYKEVRNYEGLKGGLIEPIGEESKFGLKSGESDSSPLEPQDLLHCSGRESLSLSLQTKLSFSNVNHSSLLQ